MDNFSRVYGSGPVKRAVVAAATSGDNSLVAAVAGKRIRVLGFFGLAAAAVNLYFTSAAAGTVIFGGSTNKIALPANGGFVLPEAPDGWMETVAGEALILNLSGAVVVSGGVIYQELS